MEFRLWPFSACYALVPTFSIAAVSDRLLAVRETTVCAIHAGRNATNT